MASAYATLAAGGIYSQPMAIRRVALANGKVDDQAGWGRPEQRRVIPEWVASTVTGVLEQNVRYGTGTAANFGKPAAGKTGTTDDHADAWFCGYLPNLEATVWVGYPSAEIPMENVHGIAVAGGSFPAEIWRRFVQQATRYAPAQDFPEVTAEPQWKPFKTGQYGVLYVPRATTETTTTTETKPKKPEPTVTVTPETTVQEVAPPDRQPPPPPPATTVTPTVAPPPPPPPPAPTPTSTESTPTVGGAAPP
jgi:penicillin-binding protein 1A